MNGPRVTIFKSIVAQSRRARQHEKPWPPPDPTRRSRPGQEAASVEKSGNSNIATITIGRLKIQARWDAADVIEGTPPGGFWGGAA
jgi:hypothetical protein